MSKDDHSYDPFEIEFLPQFRKGRGPREPFVNEYGVVIGDHEYDSPESPLSQWTEDTDPAIMAGDQWVHPFKDVGFHTAENREYFERGIAPASGIFMHPQENAGYRSGELSGHAAADEEESSADDTDDNPEDR